MEVEEDLIVNLVIQPNPQVVVEVPLEVPAVLRVRRMVPAAGRVVMEERVALEHQHPKVFHSFR